MGGGPKSGGGGGGLGEGLVIIVQNLLCEVEKYKLYFHTECLGGACTFFNVLNVTCFFNSTFPIVIPK